MPWAILLDLRVLLGAALIATGLYAATQRIAKEQVKSEFAQYRAEVESAAAASRVRAAQEAARQAHASQEALDALQTRYAALDRRYRVLRTSAPGTVPVPSLGSAATLLGSCPPVPGQPDPDIGRLDALEAGILEITAKADRELAKYVELWRLDQAKAARQP